MGKVYAEKRVRANKNRGEIRKHLFSFFVLALRAKNKACDTLLP